MTLPNLEQLRKRAKELIRAHRAGDDDATERLRAAVPKLSQLPPAVVQRSRLSLADAQHALAREAGHASWPALVRAVEATRVDLDGLLAAALRGDDEAVDAFPSRQELVARSLHAACAVADVAAVERSTDPVERELGPLAAPPLAYLCAARYRRGDRACAARRVRIARILLERGADASGEYADREHFDGKRVVLSAAAKHVGSAELMKTLIDAGAQRHDHSALWATVAPEHPVDDDPLAALKLMLAQRPPHWILNFALALAVRANSVAATELLLDAGASPDTGGGWGGTGTLLHQAIARGSDERILERLFERGDRTRTDREGRTPMAVAWLLGRERAVERLAALGEPAHEPTPVEVALRAAFRGDAARVAEAAAQDLPFERGDHLLLGWALRHGPPDANLPIHAAIDALLAIGLDPNVADDDGRTALSIAQEVGSPEAAARLARAGAVLASFDDDATPTDAVETFEEAATAVVEGRLERLTELLDEHPELVRWRSRRPHRATLLHYLGANGLEEHRQQTPPNAVAVCELLLERGARPDALAATYGGGPSQTTLALLASSDGPARAGLQRELVLTLCRGGARADGVDDDGVPLATAIAFHCPDAIDGLVAAGARVDNVLFAAVVATSSSGCSSAASIRRARRRTARRRCTRPPTVATSRSCGGCSRRAPTRTCATRTIGARRSAGRSRADERRSSTSSASTRCRA